MDAKQCNGWTNYATWKINIEILGDIDWKDPVNAEDLQEITEDIVDFKDHLDDMIQDFKGRRRLRVYCENDKQMKKTETEMNYDKYLFIELFRVHIEENEIPIKDLEYDLLFEIVTNHYNNFLTFNYNNNMLGLYECINNYLLNEVNY